MRKESYKNNNLLLFNVLSRWKDNKWIIFHLKSLGLLAKTDSTKVHLCCKVSVITQHANGPRDIKQKKNMWMERPGRAVSIQESSGEVRTPGNRQLSGLQEEMFHSKGKKGETEGSNYPARAVWEFYCLIIIPQRHAKLFPKLLRDASAGGRSSSSGRGCGGQRDVMCEGAHGSDKRSPVGWPGIPKPRKKGAAGIKPCIRRRRQVVSDRLSPRCSRNGLSRAGFMQVNVGFGARYLTFWAKASECTPLWKWTARYWMGQISFLQVFIFYTIRLFYRCISKRTHAAWIMYLPQLCTHSARWFIT